MAQSGDVVHPDSLVHLYPERNGGCRAGTDLGVTGLNRLARRFIVAVVVLGSVLAAVPIRPAPAAVRGPTPDAERTLQAIASSPAPRVVPDTPHGDISHPPTKSSAQTPARSSFDPARSTVVDSLTTPTA